MSSIGTMITLVQDQQHECRDFSGAMMTTVTRTRFVIMAIASLAFSSCATTHFSRTWKDPSYAGGPLKKMLVIAVRKDQLQRQNWEDGFVQALSRHGVDATASHRLAPVTLPDTNLINVVARNGSFAGMLPDTALIKAALREGNFDGMMLIGRVSAKVLENTTAGYDISSPTGDSQHWDGWYYVYYNREYAEGYPVMDGIVKDEIKVWSLKGTPRLIWSGVGEVDDSRAYEDVSGEMIALVVPELAKLGIIAGRS